MSTIRISLSILVLAAVAGICTQVGAAAGGKRVSAGSPAAPFSQNKQNEPAVAVDPMHPNVLVAGANDEIDMEACNAGADDTCPFTAGVGVSGFYATTTGGGAWVQPTYTGLSARNCLGAVGDSDPPCTPQMGPIGTLPWYAENGLTSDGDPALAFGPTFVNGSPSWSASRLYYANLTSSLSGAFKGAEAIAVSWTDNVPAAAAGDKAAWHAPVLASKQNSGLFADKEQIWADNARSSTFFGNVYVCYAAYQGNGNGFTNQSLDVITSRDGGQTWVDKQVTPAANNPSSRQGFGRSGCTVRTDSRGNVYVFFTSGSIGVPAPMTLQMVKSTDGGATWSRPAVVATGHDTCVFVEASIGRCVMDGVAGARDDLGPAPSVDIANGAPLGLDATNRIVLTWVDGGAGLNHEHVMFTWSDNGGSTWQQPAQQIERPGDRGYYSAPAISPDGRHVWLVYNAFTTLFKPDTRGPANDRRLVGVVLHAPSTAAGVGAFTEVDRGIAGDARGSSQNNLAAEFLGDYVYAAATRTFGAAVWNDVRNAADCPAMDQYRWDLHQLAISTGAATADAEEPRGADEGRDADAGAAATPVPPDVQQACPANFGNSDIFGDVYPNP